MANLDLKLRSILGPSSHNIQTSTVSFYDEETVLYSSEDTTLIFQNIFSGKQEFLHVSRNHILVHWTCCHPWLVLAQVCKEAEENFTRKLPRILIYNASNWTQGPVAIIDLNTEDISERSSPLFYPIRPALLTAIQPDDEVQMLVTVHQSTKTASVLSCWNATEGVLLCYIEIDNLMDLHDKNAQISFHSNGTLICISHTAQFWIYQIVDDNIDIVFQLMASKCFKDLTCHCWLDDGNTDDSAGATSFVIAFGTWGSGVLVVSDKDISVSGSDDTLSNLIATQVAESKIPHVNTLLPYQEGFVVVCAHPMFSIYAKSSQGEDGCYGFTCVNNMLLKEPEPHGRQKHVRSMSLSPNGHLACCLIVGLNEIYTFELTGITRNQDDLTTSVSSNSNICEGYNRLVAGHDGPINDLDVCTQKPLILTGGTDQTVRVWDFLTGAQILCKSFQAEPISTKLHPSGLHAILLFSDEAVCVHILVDDFRPFRQLPQCRQVSFNKGGHAYACVMFDNSITVSDFYTGFVLQTLKGHNSKILEIQWDVGDNDLISFDDSGVMYRWDVDNGERLNECIRYSRSKHRPSFTSINRESIWIAHNGYIEVISKQIFDKQKAISEADKKVTGPIRSSCVESSFVIVGTASLSDSTSNDPDTLSMYNILNQECKDVICQCSFANIKISHNDQHLIVAGIHGSIHVMDIIDKRGCDQTLITAEPREKHIKVSTWLAHSSVSEIYLEEKGNSIQELQALLKEVRSNHDYKIEMQKLNERREIAKIESDYLQIVAESTERTQSLFNKMDTLKLRHQKAMEDDNERNNMELFHVETNHRSKTQNVVNEQNLKQNKYDENMEKLRLSKKESNRKHTSRRKELERDMNIQLTKEKKSSNNLQNDMNELKIEFEETIKQVEEEVDDHIESKKLSYEKELSVRRERTLKKLGENGIMQKRSIALCQTIGDQKDSIKLLLTREEDIREHLKQLKDAIKGKQNTLLRKEKSLILKNNTITRLQAREKELKKLNYILEDKVNELKSCTIPTNEHIEKFRGEVATRKTMLSRHSKDHYELKIEMERRKRDIEETKKGIAKLNERLKGDKSIIKWLEIEIHNLMILIQDPSRLVSKLQELNHNIKKTTPEGCLKIDSHYIPTKDIEELNRSKKTVERRLGSIKSIQQQELKSLMNENISTLKDIQRVQAHIKQMNQCSLKM